VKTLGNQLNRRGNKKKWELSSNGNTDCRFSLLLLIGKSLYADVGKGGGLITEGSQSRTGILLYIYITCVVVFFSQLYSPYGCSNVCFTRDSQERRLGLHSKQTSFDFGGKNHV